MMKPTSLPILLLLLPFTLFLTVEECRSNDTQKELSAVEKQRQSDSRAWLRRLKKEADSETGPLQHKSVRRLAELIKTDAVVRMYVTQMLDQVPKKHRVFESTKSLVRAFDLILGRAPSYQEQTPFPISTLLTDLMYTPGGEAGFRNAALNSALRDVLKEWCRFLDSKRSRYVINRKGGWLSPAAWKVNKLDDFVIPDPNAPHGGFASFNAFFHRKIRTELRPIASPNDPKIIVSANDGTVYRVAKGVKKMDRFWLKGQPYSLWDMLDRSPYVSRFEGGDVFQSFLSGSDYHRFHAPISGTVREVKLVPGLMFSELRSEGFDPSGGTLSQGYQASVNTRGLVFIESGKQGPGLVCVIPIGITEVSSVTLTVKQGQKVKKGDEIGYFSYGGSSMCLVFERGAIARYTITAPKRTGDLDHGPKIKVNAAIAQAK